MWFEMPEHILLTYIRRHDGLHITSLEWRDFLIYCEQRVETFRYARFPLFQFQVNKLNKKAGPQPALTDADKELQD